MKLGVKYRIMSILDELRVFVKRNLLFIIIFSAFFVIGFIIGISVALRAEDSKASLAAFNWLICGYAVNNLNLFLYFFLRLCALALISFIFSLLSFNVYLSFIYIAVFIYMGMSLGGPIVLLFDLYGFASIIIDLFGFLLFELVFAAYFILYASHMFCLAVENHRYGCNYAFRQLLRPLPQQYFFLAALLLAQTIMLFMCSIFVL